MGIRISAFAVDCVGFRDWLHRPVGDVLFYIARHAVGEPPFFNVHEPESLPGYLISPNRDVLFYERGKGWKPVAEEVARRTPLLMQPLGAYLSRGSVFDIKSLFYSLAACADV
jgi:hypothetical protein